MFCKSLRSLTFLSPLSSPQVFVGKIPRDLYEDELVPLFESAGPIWDLRLMMDPLSGQNRGYAFITYCNKDDAQKAVKLVSNVAGNISPYFNSLRRNRLKGLLIRKCNNLCFTVFSAHFTHLLTCLGFFLLLFFYSVITMKSALASTWEFVYLLQTIACLSARFQRTKQEKVYWKTLAKWQVCF